MLRPPGVYEGSIAVLSGRESLLIYNFARLDEIPAARRARYPELDAAINKLQAAGAGWLRAERGTDTPPPAEPRGGWYSTKEAGERVGVTDRTIRKAIADGRLAAEIDGAEWRIAADALALYRPRVKGIRR